MNIIRSFSLFLLPLIAIASVIIATMDVADSQRARGPQGDSVRWMPVGSSTAQAIEDGGFVRMVDGYIVAAATGADDVWGVALSSAPIPSTSGGSRLLVDFSSTRVHWFPSSTTPAQSVVGTLIDLANHTTVNPSASTDDVLEVVAADIDGFGYFVRLNPNERGPNLW